MPIMIAHPWSEMEGAAFEDLAREHGTPFFLYDADAINARVQAIRQAFTGTVKVFYAVKANPNLALLRAVRATVDGLDISSSVEFEQALLVGYDAGRLSFWVPEKSTADPPQPIRY